MYKIDEAEPEGYIIQHHKDGKRERKKAKKLSKALNNRKLGGTDRRNNAR